jgi:uncharacterized integral membrane protein (TIGR00698 family)
MRVLPGLALAGAAAALAAGLHQAISVPPIVAAVALGVLLGNLGLVPACCVPGLSIASSVALRAGVVLLGLELAFPDVVALGGKALAVVVATVAVTFVATVWAGQRLGLSPGLSTLVAVGFSICGVSAIAAATAVVDAEEDEIAFSVALVTLCGTLAILVLPLLREPLGLGEEAYGAWVGASVHDVGQVVATSSTAGSVALATAIVVKLTRVVLLAPLVGLLAVARHRSARAGVRGIPFFVLLFVGAIAVASIDVLPEGVAAGVGDVRTAFFAAALFAIGTRVRARQLARVGTRPLALGVTSWVLIAAVAYVGVLIGWS